MPTRKEQPPKRRQVNIGFDPADYERIQVAAADLDITPTEYIRDCALEALDPEPADIANPNSTPAMPGWLIALLVYLRGGRGPVDDKRQGSTAAADDFRRWPGARSK